MDARFPERWLNDRRILRLTPDGFRLFVLALAWSVSNRTDGVLYDDDLHLIPGANLGMVPELQKSGLWQRTRDRWVIADYADTQTSRDELEVLDNARRRQREKKARQRARKAAEPDEAEPPASDSPPVTYPGTDPGTGTPVQHRLGKDRQGKDRQGQEGLGSDPDDVPDDVDPDTGERRAAAEPDEPEPDPWDLDHQGHA